MLEKLKPPPAPQKVKRSKVLEAARLLGLDPHTVKSVVLGPEEVVVHTWLFTEDGARKLDHNSNRFYEHTLRLEVENDLEGAR